MEYVFVGLWAYYLRLFMWLDIAEHKYKSTKICSLSLLLNIFPSIAREPLIRKPFNLFLFLQYLDVSFQSRGVFWNLTMH